MLFRIRARNIFFNCFSWKSLIALGIIALILHIINLGLSWWIEVVSSKKNIKLPNNFLLHHPLYFGRKFSSIHAEILEHITRWSVLDGSGEYKISLGVLHGKESLELTDDNLNNVSNDPAVALKEGDVTLVTQCSLSRLHLLPDVAKRWQGPLSVAVFLLAEDIHVGIQLLLLLRKCYPEIQTNVTFSVVFPSSSTMDLHSSASPEDMPCTQIFPALTPEYERTNYNFSGIPYPNNLMRNVARKVVDTSFMMVLDVDMLPSKDLYPKFLNYIKENHLIVPKGKKPETNQDKTVWVVPSYEIREDSEVPDDKATLMKLKKESKARPFYQELCWKCQKYTEYETWERYSDHTDRSLSLKHLYEVLWKDPWEPFYIAKTNVPFYDERFRQYGFNRISQVCELHIAGYRFLVLDGVFVVHKGYKRSGQMHSTKDEELERNRILFRDFKTSLKEKYPESSRRCY